MNYFNDFGLKTEVVIILWLWLLEFASGLVKYLSSRLKGRRWL